MKSGESVLSRRNIYMRLHITAGLLISRLATVKLNCRNLFAKVGGSLIALQLTSVLLVPF